MKKKNITNQLNIFKRNYKDNNGMYMKIIRNLSGNNHLSCQKNKTKTTFEIILRNSHENKNKKLI